jgi:hypothetical protein
MITIADRREIRRPAAHERRSMSYRLRSTTPRTSPGCTDMPRNLRSLHFPSAYDGRK